MNESANTPVYDSARDTQAHIDQVRVLIYDFAGRMFERAASHDRSKLHEPEKSVFDEFTPKLKASTYGSDEYAAMLKEMQVALSHHYANNRHHAEYHNDGICGMNLVDLVEMLCDWMAATQRHANGDIHKSIEINQRRFGYTDELKQIFQNTVWMFED